MDEFGANSDYHLRTDSSFGVLLFDTKGQPTLVKLGGHMRDHKAPVDEVPTPVIRVVGIACQYRLSLP